jgi:hypothetical protein
MSPFQNADPGNATPTPIMVALKATSPVTTPDRRRKSCSGQRLPKTIISVLLPGARPLFGRHGFERNVS